MSKKKYYVVIEGRQPGIYHEWYGPDGAEAQVKGFPDAVFKSFQSRTEAERWFNERSGLPAVHIAESEAQEHPEEDYFLIHTKALEEGNVVIYTDGGCDGNPGKGSYGVVLLYKTHRKEISAGYALTTSNRMELMACIAALQTLKQQSNVVLFSDSSYVVNGIKKGWALKWRANGWKRTQDGQLVAVRNADLWQKLLELCAYHEVAWVKVRGHAGSAENERCHQLASAVLTRDNLPADQMFENEKTTPIN